MQCSGGADADGHAADAGAVRFLKTFGVRGLTRVSIHPQVGRTLMGTQQMRERAGGKGRCVELLHAFGDMLCVFRSCMHMPSNQAYTQLCFGRASCLLVAALGALDA